MNYLVEWTFLSRNSYFQEIDFIHLKWNEKEVNRFEFLVETELKRLSKNPNLGINYKDNIYSLHISKQTTLYYRIINDTIELLLFWNNSKNPDDLMKLL